jgi:hypothetical protein
MEEITQCSRLSEIISPTYSPLPIAGVDNLFDPVENDVTLKRLLISRIELLYKTKVLSYIAKYYPPKVGHISVKPNGITCLKGSYADGAAGVNGTMTIMRGMVEELILLRMRITRLNYSLEGMEKACTIQEDHGVGRRKRYFEDIDFGQLRSLLGICNTTIESLNALATMIFTMRTRLHVLEPAGTSRAKAGLNPVINLHYSSLVSEASEDIREVEECSEGKPPFECNFIKVLCARDSLYNVTHKYLDFNRAMLTFYRSYEFIHCFESNLVKGCNLTSYTDNDIFIPQRFRWVTAETTCRDNALFAMMRALRSRAVKQEARMADLRQAISRFEKRYIAVLNCIREQIEIFKVEWMVYVGNGEWMEQYMLRGPLLHSFVDIETHITSVYELS